MPMGPKFSVAGHFMFFSLFLRVNSKSQERHEGVSHRSV